MAVGALDQRIYSNGAVIPLASLGAFCNITMGINDHGDVVGRSASHCNGTRFPLVFGDATQRAFLNHNGAVYDLNNLITTSGWMIYEAAAINNNGQIAGTGIFNGKYFAIRLDPETGTSFYAVTPCRLIDTRIQLGDPNGPIQSGQYRYPLLVGHCGLRSGTKAVSLNVTIVNPSAEGFLTLAAAVGSPPQTSTINFRRGQVRANNQVVGLNSDGTLAIFCGMSAAGAVNYIIDVSGYFQ